MFLAITAAAQQLHPIPPEVDSSRAVPLCDNSLGWDPSTLPPVPRTFASPWDYRSLGIFCKADVQFRRLLPIPLLIRLDDVQRVEGLEGKGPLAPLR